MYKRTNSRVQAFYLPDWMEAGLLFDIRVRTHLPNEWKGWFEGIELLNLPEGECIIRGDLPDQAALFGILNLIQARGLELIAVVPQQQTETQNRQ